MGRMDLVALHRDTILRIAAQHGVHHVRVFGSVARGTDRTESDIDLLVTAGDKTSLLDLVALERELSELLDARVQVVSDGGLKPWVRSQILAEAVEV